MGNKYLLLWLEGPLQAWGTDSKFNARSTLAFPSKSGIIGMILAGAGKEGKQKELLSLISECKQSVYVLKEGKLLIDFQTAGNGYNIADNWQKNMIPKKRDGGNAVGSGSKLIYKSYIQDAVFSVIQEFPLNLEEMILDAFSNPVWALYLGRKSCNPSTPVFCGIFDSVDDAESALKIRLEERPDLKIGKKIIDGDFPEKGNVITLSDVPSEFGKEKKYKSRYVTIVE